MSKEWSKGALPYGFTGLGQCGNKLVDICARNGYPAIAANTTNKDLDGLSHVSATNRYLMTYPGTRGGAGKNPQIGREAAEHHKENLINKINAAFPYNDFIWLCVGFGGGTGTGTVPVVLDTLLDNTQKDVGIIATIPHRNEGMEVKNNALQAMVEVFGIASEANVPIIIVDNEEIFKRMNSTQRDWRDFNEEVMQTILNFNKTVNRESSYSTFDEADYRKTLCVPGSCAITKVEIPAKDFLSGPQKLTELMLAQWENNLVGIADYSNAQIAGIILEAPKKILDNRGHYNLITAALDHLKKAAGIKCPYEGIYTLEKDDKDMIIVQVLLSGMPAPKDRLKIIHSEALVEQKEVSERLEKTLQSMDLSEFSVGSVSNPLNQRRRRGCTVETAPGTRAISFELK